MKKILAWVLALSLLLCGAAFAEDTEEIHVKVGVVGENNEQWEQVIIPTLAQEGIEIELVKFSDYIIPNQALANGDVDLNAFQHYDFMEQSYEMVGERTGRTYKLGEKVKVRVIDADKVLRTVNFEFACN